ncbi:hypothetical protein [Hymenobacter jeollabukensis]|uniref:DUF4252 domain-containing protein n=1 Tax=Hymenobacter jeollabukensis TaxID=2025313 RepID=A0A5R8WTV0_9BACT|nr:hypothetical protein [Hymenobacter jeollabukensis]TLM95189.1 hypothetical protein FDY95_05210 [Hymenobacter jeollabukensis]
MKKIALAVLLQLLCLGLRAQTASAAYEQAALNFFVDKELAEYRFPLAFCGQTAPRPSHFDHMLSCFGLEDADLPERLKSAAEATPVGASVPLQWNSPQLRRGCRIRKKRPLVVVYAATQLQHNYYVKLSIGGVGGATHYMFELAEGGQILRWCRNSENF